MKPHFEITFDYIDSIADETGVIGRVIRNDYIIISANTETEARRKFYATCSGIIKTIRIIYIRRYL